MQQELEILTQVADSTRQVLSDEPSLTMESVSDLLDRREDWISMLKRLRTLRATMGDQPGTSETDLELRAQIRSVSNMICDMDEKLNKFMQRRRMQIVKDLSGFADINSRRASEKKGKFQGARLIDIRQR